MRLALGPRAPGPGPRAPGLSQESLRGARELLVVPRARLVEDTPHVRAQRRLAPVVARRRLRAPGVALHGGVEQRTGGRGVERGIVTGRQAESAGTLEAAGVLVDEGSGHGTRGRCGRT